jgi:hypothetical protein
MKKIKAWAFLAYSKDGKYFIEGDRNEDTVYFKKPKPRGNPFAYGSTGDWKPDEITIIIKNK